MKAYTYGLRADDTDEMNSAFDRVASAVREALSAAFTATHRSLDILRSIDPAASVQRRWTTDVREWTSHAVRSAKGVPRFARRHDALRAAQTLQRWSSAADALETDRVFDDPMLLAHLDAEGRCITGRIREIDLEHREIKEGNKNRSRVPLVELDLTTTTRLLERDAVRWGADRRVKAEIRRVDDASVTLAVTGGAKAFTESGLSVGSEAVFVGLDPWDGFDPISPDEVPWTHRLTPDPEDDVADDPGAGSDDDAPDMTLDELAEIPIVGLVAPGDEPAVLL